MKKRFMEPTVGNMVLRYAIGVLSGEHFRARPKNRLHYALGVKELFEEVGLWWQARILGFHIHRFQRAHKGELLASDLHSARGRSDLLSEEGEGEASLDPPMPPRGWGP